VTISAYPAISGSFEHEDLLRLRRLNAGCLLSLGTFAGTQGKGRDAPKPAIRLIGIEPLSLTQNGG
jgi:hypothetical protein